MSSTSLLYIFGSVVVTAVAQLCIKVASRQFSGGATAGNAVSLAGSLVQQALHPLSIVAVFAYAISLLLWFLALRDVPLSVAYPFAGLTMALVAALGIVVLGESVDLPKLVGITLIIAGVVLLART